jgi:hypothetical protein
MTVKIETKALSDLEGFFAALPDVAEKAMATAINQVAERDGLALLKRDMRNQVDFPAGYLETGPKGARLGATGRKAGRGHLERIIRGRDRPTSLARFAQGQTPRAGSRLGVRVTIKPGRTRLLKKAFLVNLRNGNTGLAVRLKGGDTLKFSSGAVELGNNLYLLYGPSVNQVFTAVASDKAGAVGDMVRKQFLRQFNRFNRNG